MRECKKSFINNTQQTQTPGKDFNPIPTVRYIHTCKAAKIGLIVLPETEDSKQELSKATSKTCKEHCKKI
ncbi:hypothetical protein [Aminipila luticellarii]|uniref:Uncharacterized protein n=1 Tax=Aminipila luticellarii TaxID=2507160 RepID=A0A410PX20_9FIRM|nr:hypothetical protein [Aminipila luticellarii]QAT43455.1 hypothetical protein EQM06_09630 [Aminipila luticellarii]